MDAGTSSSRKRRRSAMQSSPRPAAVNPALLPSSPPPQAQIATTSRERMNTSEEPAERAPSTPQSKSKQKAKMVKPTGRERTPANKADATSPQRLREVNASPKARRSPRTSKASPARPQHAKAKSGSKKLRRADQRAMVQPTSSQDDQNSRASDDAAIVSQHSQAELEAAKLECAHLNSRIKYYEGIISGQKATISHFYGQCSCTICMELVWRPHVLSPCGHVFCASCLVDWFQRPLEHEGPLPDNLTADQRAQEVRRRTIRRRKICPHCRVRVEAVPAEVWMVKGLLETIEKSMAKGEGNEDHLVEGMAAEHGLSSEQRRNVRGENLPSGDALWKDIFDSRSKSGVVYDDAEGIIRCGVCASEVIRGVCVNPGCGTTYSDVEDHDPEGDDMDDSELEREFGEDSFDEDEDDDDSFIDDDEALLHVDADAYEVDSHDSEEDDEDDGHLSEGMGYDDDEDVQEVDADGRPTGPHAPGRIVIAPSDSESSGGSDVHVLGVQRRWGARPLRVLLDDDDEEEEEHGDHLEADHGVHGVGYDSADGYRADDYGGHDHEDEDGEGLGSPARYSDEFDDGETLGETESEEDDEDEDDPDFDDDDGEHDDIEWMDPQYLDAYPMDFPDHGENDMHHPQREASRTPDAEHEVQADPLDDYAAYQGYLQDGEDDLQHAADSEGSVSPSHDAHAYYYHDDIHGSEADEDVYTGAYFDDDEDDDDDYF